MYSYNSLLTYFSKEANKDVKLCDFDKVKSVCFELLSKKIKQLKNNLIIWNINLFLLPFKGIKATSIDLSQGLYSLVGINESGKTTLLKAIKQTYELLQEENLNGNFEKIRPKITNFTGKIELQVGLQLSEKDKKQSFFKDKFVNNIIIVKFTYECKSARLVDNWKDNYRKISNVVTEKKITKPQEVKIFAYIKTNVNPILLYNHFLNENPNSIIFYDRNSNAAEIASDAIFQDDLNKEWQKILADIGRVSYDGFDSIQNDIVDWKLGNPNSNDDQNKLADINSKLTEVIIKKWSKLYKRKAIKEIKIEREIQKTDSSKSTKHIFKIIVYGIDNKPYEVSERSLGFKWFFSFLLFTEFRKSRHNNTMFMLDEPASNLYATSQESVLESLHDLSKQTCVIYTTHSPYLYSGQYLGNSYLITNNNNAKKDCAESDIKANVLSKIDLKNKPMQEYMRTILDSYKLNLNIIELGDKNVFMEGFED